MQFIKSNVLNLVLWHKHKKRKDSLEGSLERVLFAAKLEFSKILAHRLLQNTRNANTICCEKSKQLYSLCDQLLVALIYIHCYDINLFLIDYAWCLWLCNIMLLFSESNSRSNTTKEWHWRKNIAVVITQDRVIEKAN